MNPIRKASPFLIAVALCLLATVPAMAAPSCLKVQSRFSLQLVGGSECSSPIGLCAIGEYHGSLRGESEFAGTSFGPTDDPEATTMAVLTGDNVIHTPSGDLWTKDAIVLALDEGGEFAELDTIVGGTGDFANASGRLIGTGTLKDGAGKGIVTGEVCWP